MKHRTGSAICLMLAVSILDAMPAAAKRGWISGYPDGTRRPDGGATRAEASAIIDRMLGREASWI